MKKNSKRRLILFSIVLVMIVSCMLIGPLTSCAALIEKDEIPIPTVKKDVYVYDEDDIIEDDVESKVNTLLIQLEEKTGAEIAVITVKSLLGKEIEDYSYELANTLGIGKADEDNGVLLLISKTDERVRLEIGKGLEGCLNDSKCGRILDDYFVPYREKDEYSEGTYKTIEAVVSVIAQEYEVTIGDVDDTLAKKMDEDAKKDAIKAVIIIIIIVIVLIILLVCDNIFLDGAITQGFVGGSSSGGGGFGGGGASR